MKILKQLSLAAILLTSSGCTVYEEISAANCEKAAEVLVTTGEYFSTFMNAYDNPKLFGALSLCELRGQTCELELFTTEYTVHSSRNSPNECLLVVTNADVVVNGDIKDKVEFRALFGYEHFGSKKYVFTFEIL